jgi:hypothetical protein
LQCQQISGQLEGPWAIAIELLNIRVSEQLSTQYQGAQDLGERGSSFFDHLIHIVIFVERQKNPS